MPSARTGPSAPRDAFLSGLLPPQPSAREIAIDSLIDAAIEAAPDCVPRRVILPAVDWTEVAPQKVKILLATLAQAKLSVPGWLAKSLLLAGHVLPFEIERTLPAGLAMLNRLNRATGETHERETMLGALEALRQDETLERDLAAALVGKLVALSWDEDAARLALAQRRHAPEILRRADRALGHHIARLPSVRLRLAGFSTTHTLAEDLGPAFAAKGWRADVGEAPFASVFADLMGPAGDVEAHIVLLDLEGFAGSDWRRTAADSFALLVERAESLAAALRDFARRAEVPLLINTIPVPAAPTAGLLDRSHATGARRAVDLVNRHLLEAAEASSRIVLIDADQALAALPLRDHADPRLWFYGRLAYSAEATRALAGAFAEAWSLLRRGTAKVLAVDLDNTLWGGVYGDDGIERLACGEDFPGNAFRAMQSECLRLRQQGLLLVALSKNNPDAISAFARHPGMVLRPEDFVAQAINWEPKPDNIRKIAADLALGLDSFVFLDDSPHERDQMRLFCPEVAVPEMPSDPAARPHWLRRLAATWPVRLTPEDESRAALYAARRAAESARTSAGSFEAYLEGLEQHLSLSFVSAATLPRVAQMHQRTNQFNLTTRRSTEADIAALIGDPARGLAVVGRVRDKFGDHGLVVAATVEIEGDAASIRSLLMSCRVIGREVERAFLGALVEELARRGVVRIRGTYIPTPKNALVRDFYASCGWAPDGIDGEGSAWSFTIGSMEPPASRFVAMSWEA